MTTLNFYRDLPVLPSLREATRAQGLAALPLDWWVVVTDVAGSTKAIEAGEYKKVNTVGVACIAAVLNVDRSVALPFVFGGDGATFAIPDALREAVIPALRGAQTLSQDSFGLGLRVGLVSVRELVNFGVYIGKVHLSANAVQTTLSGRGWEEAERRLKTPSASGILRVEPQTGASDANFAGFSCRWQSIPSFRDHKLSLLIAAQGTDPAATYQRVLANIESIYGEVDSYHPLRSSALQMAVSPDLLQHEWRVQYAQRPALIRWLQGLKMGVQGIIGRAMFGLNLHRHLARWRRYRENMVENSDFRKFDGMLRMVIDSSRAQTDALTTYLAQEHANGTLVYGIHPSPEALVTCLVHDYRNDHIHFVDGSDGGYALAARQLKKQLGK